MTGPRIQVGTDIQAPALRPAANPRDTFVQAQVSGSQGAQLASALASLAPELSRFGQQVFERQAQTGKLKGEQLARDTVSKLDANRTNLAAEVRNGTLPAHLNPFMKVGYYEELGRLYAGRFQADLTSAIQQDEGLQNSIELGDFRKFTADFEARWKKNGLPAEANNSAFVTGFGNRRDAILQNMEAGFAAQTEQKFAQRTMSMFRDEAITFISDALDVDQGTDQIAGSLRQLLDDKFALGWPGAAVNRTLIAAVSDVALLRKDPDLIRELLGKIPGGGPGSPLGDLARTADGIKAINDTEDEVARIRNRDMAAEQRNREKAAIAIKQELATRLEQAEQAGLSPDEVDINDLQSQAILEGNPDLVENIQIARDAYGNREYVNDKSLVADFAIAINTDPFSVTQSRLDRALRNKSLSLATYNDLSSRLAASQKEARERASSGNSLEKDAGLRRAEAVAAAYFTVNEDTEANNVVRHATIQAKRSMANFYYQQFLAPGAPNANATEKQKRDAADDFAADLSRVWQTADAAQRNDGAEGILRIIATDLDWRTRPIAVPFRNEVLVRLLESFTKRGAVTEQDVSVLRIYGIDFNDKPKVAEFLSRQFELSKPTTTN